MNIFKLIAINNEKLEKYFLPSAHRPICGQSADGFINFYCKF